MTTLNILPALGGSDLPDEARLEYGHLSNKLSTYQASNAIKAQFYDMENQWRDLGIAVPPRFKDIEIASGWGTKAVDHLARRIRMESFTLPGGMEKGDTWGLQEMWDDNRMEIDLPNAITSALIHSPGFLLTMAGEADLGEPEIVISAHDAMHATGEWNWSRRGLDSALIVVDESRPGDLGVMTSAPTRILLFHDQVMWDLRRDRVGGAWTEMWSVQGQEYTLGRLPVEPLLYHPRTARPFGGTRITKSVRYIINGAIRTLIRSELGAEFFATPQRYALNVDERDLTLDGTKSKWDVMIGKLLTLGASQNPDDPDPVLGQFPQVSMQPHVDHLRMFATLLSGETGIPVGSLGVIQDNPSSAEAIYANKEDLVLEAEEAARIFAPAIRRTAFNAIQTRDDIAEVPAELKKLGIRWIDPSMPSRNQAADYVLKQTAAGVLPPTSEITYEKLGYRPEEIVRLQEDDRLNQARQTVRAALSVSPKGAPAPAAPGTPGSPTQPQQAPNTAPPPPAG